MRPKEEKNWKRTAFAASGALSSSAFLQLEPSSSLPFPTRRKELQVYVANSGRIPVRLWPLLHVAFLGKQSPERINLHSVESTERYSRNRSRKQSH